MTYEEIVAKVTKEFSSVDVSKYDGHLALQIDIIGEGEGAFYTEVIDGKIVVEPFEYYNNDAKLIAAAEDLIDIVTGKIEPAKAYEEGRLFVEGDTDKAFEIKTIIENKKVSKPRKARAVKPDESKTEKKTAVKVEKPEKTAEIKIEKLDAKQLSFTEQAASAVKTKVPVKETVKAESKTASKAVKESAVKATTGKTAKTGAKKG